MEPAGDPDIEELKEQIQKQTELLQDTNRIVHKLRRNIWWGRVWTVVWWVAIFAASGAAYYYYAQPYINTLEHYYAGFQKSAGQASNFETQVQNWLSQFSPGSTTPTSTPGK